jgi:hypothetical protein
LLDEFGKVMRQDRGRREGGSTALAYSSGWIDAYYMHSAKAHSTQEKNRDVHFPLNGRIEVCTFHSTEE